MAQKRKIHQLPAIDRPREKLERKGTSALSDFELLEVMIGNGNAGGDVSFIARKVQQLLRSGTPITYESLTNIKGVSTVLAGKVLSALEISRRHLLWEALPLNSLKDVLARLDSIRDKQQEYVVCLSLDGGQRLIAQRTVTIGTLDASLAHPREIYADAIADRAACIIVAHNHPSGEVLPSAKDITLTQQLAAAGQILGIGLRDHLIVAKADHFSFRQHHLI